MYRKKISLKNDVKLLIANLLKEEIHVVVLLIENRFTEGNQSKSE